VAVVVGTHLSAPQVSHFELVLEVVLLLAALEAVLSSLEVVEKAVVLVSEVAAAVLFDSRMTTPLVRKGSPAAAVRHGVVAYL